MCLCYVKVNPSDAGIYDRVVIQELIKTVASTDQLDSGCQKDFKVQGENKFRPSIFYTEEKMDWDIHFKSTKYDKIHKWKMFKTKLFEIRLCY